MTGRSKGFAFLDFESKESAEAAAAALAGVRADDRELKVDVAEPGSKPTRERTFDGSRPPRAPLPPSDSSVFVGNLAFETSEEDIREAFEGTLGAGAVQRVRIAMDRETGRAKGFAHVDLSSPDLAGRAVNELANLEMNGRSMRVDHAQRRDPNAPPGAAPNAEGAEEAAGAAPKGDAAGLEPNAPPPNAEVAGC